MERRRDHHSNHDRKPYERPNDRHSNNDREREGGRSRDRVQRRDADEGEPPSNNNNNQQQQQTKDAPKPKEAPNFGVSGALTAEANTFKGVVLKYAEPQEARKPVTKYRLYSFKGKEQVDMIPVSRQSAYLFGRDRIVADIPVDHPSISKQHAVLQYRFVSSSDQGGRAVKPYIIDLDSANGTFLNGQKIDGSRYYELKNQDVIKFGFSSRDHVLMAEDADED
ncbi:SMAD/FHA domain-containing protein [Rhizoclosmatium globosum]|uniref:SMAD/FHA domain-containing protein n=1 Tax=Rhizoclosmatium globosum TaxID=329046 RepID=A0A1Y2BEM0_9FUNG|nr:SMAD/FHA domain-containing protein [Rhizoclosmatium globosum]|eukprot:ORY32980.1 SMAD/FHA domain-containing protein [Rhizoclosmatium globosum]